MPVAVSWGDGYHKLLVTGTETIDGQEYIKYINPWGREERMPREEFEARLADINYDPRAQLQASLGGLGGGIVPQPKPTPSHRSDGDLDRERLQRYVQVRG
ncbi:hypothetical protein [Archangium violaceum]|uniref:Uncharacterized protein n=1 Tax=Archangium violaceum Cb vi76 TaxID=1406225 RepID=A0A084SZY6_9BACT|nr:hypothetical protein [Archangium violaceum]KFA94021.1 hypothetical protein Q664_05535 [Archangium violaceum Cb vi76]